MRLLKFVVCDGLYYKSDGVSCDIGDYLILKAPLTYVLGEVQAVVYTTEDKVDKLTPMGIGEVVANSTETIKHYEGKNED